MPKTRKRNAKFCSRECRTKDFSNRHPNYWRQFKTEESRIEGRKQYRDKYRCRVLTTYVNGKQIIFRRVTKLPYPKDGCCQICGKKVKMLAYHHWDKVEEGRLVKGLWLCQTPCHNVVEPLEQGILENITEKYLRLKEEINSKEMN